MTTVYFPGLGLEFSISDVAFSIGGFEIYWYAIVMCLGCVLAVLTAYKLSPTFGINGDRFVDVIFAGFIGGIVGARAYYVIFDWDRYKDNLLEIFNFRNGGMAFYGSVIGGVLLAYIVCRKRRQNVAACLDVAGIGFLIGQGFGRWGNFFNQEAFGCNTNLPWGMISEKTTAYLESMKTYFDVRDIVVDPAAPVHPCFLYESIWCFIGLGVLLWLIRRRKFDGQLFLTYIAWNCFGRFFIEGLRTDSLMIGKFIRVSQLLAAVGFIVAVGLILYMFNRIKTLNDPDLFMPFGMRPDWRERLAAIEGMGKEEYKMYCQQQAKAKKRERSGELFFEEDKQQSTGENDHGTDN